jgi:O-succinylbenzoate synthase
LTQPHVYSIPMRVRFRGIDIREGVLIEGAAGWGEFCPFLDYGDHVATAWLAAALEACTTGWPAPVRERVPVNCTIPAVGPERAYEIAANSSCLTAKVKVADHRDSLGEDLERLAAVRDAMGTDGLVRCDANGLWEVEEAVTAIRQLDRAAGGLQYVEQPCRTIDELAAVRKRVDVPIAADESIRQADDPMRVAVAEAADIAVLKCAPLGGVRRALEVAEAAGLPCVVSSALETSVGLAAELALAGALPELDYACGLGTIDLLAGDVVAASLVPVDGTMPVPLRAPAPDDALLECFAAADDRARWWQERLERVGLELGAATT